MFAITVILSLLLAVAFVAAGSAKITNNPQIVSNLRRLRVDNALIRPIGVLEVLGAAGLVIGLAWAPLGAAAALGLFGLMVGALRYHARAHDAPPALAPPALLGLLALAAFVLRIATS